MTNPPEDQSQTDFGDPRWSRVKRVFDAARQLSPEQREVYLASVCGTDAEVREEVNELLEDCDEAGNFLNTEPDKPAVLRTFQAGDVLVNRFRIIDYLGSGGMGQVYSAEDMLSGGPVALKAIRPEIASDAQSSRRFRRELRLSRQVSHPNVCRVYELWSMPVEGGDNVVFLTMELLEGETLAARLAKTSKIPPKAALAIARQIASGIAEVHRIGIVHRDVKPSNVYLVPDGAGNDRAVVMDFGLARSVVRTGGADVTVAGSVLGTPTYMAPELFEGKEATVCSDIYGFGVTLYEMLTGRNRMIVAPRKLVAGLEDGWERAIIQCLQPDPAKRPSSILSVIDLIERGPRVARLKIALATAAVLSAIFVFLFLAVRPAGSIAPKDAKIARLTFDKGLVEEVSYSADGKTMVYSSDQGTPDGNLSIWVNDPATGNRRQLVKSRWHDYEPAVSPDGKLVAFHSDRYGSALYTVPIQGGTPKFLVAFGHNPRFSADGKFLAYWTGQPGDVSEAISRAYVIPLSGGAPRPIAPQFADVRFPVWSPDAHLILFWGAPTGLPSVTLDTDWYVQNIDTGAIARTHAFQTFRREGLDPHSAPVSWTRGSIVFSARSTYSNNIWQMPFSEEALGSVGAPHHLTTGSGFEVIPWVLPDGKITYANWTGTIRVWRVSTGSGEHQGEMVTEEDARDMRPTVSRNGRFLLFGRRLSDQMSICLRDMERGTETTLTSADRRFPAISPDGKRAAYTESTNAGIRIWVKTIAASSEAAECDKCGPILSWLPDNSGLLYLQKSQARTSQVRTLNLSTGAGSTLLADDLLSGASVSPDMRRIAFTAIVDGSHSVIYTAPFVRGAQTPLASRIPLTGDSVWEEKPQWSDDGREIFFSSNRDGFVCLWRQRISRDGHAVHKPESILHMHRAALSPMGLSHVPFYNLSSASRYLYYNLAMLTGNLWQFQP